ncbi:MAG: acyltransferase family protein [Acidimicrobiales bacterium]|nr:acyltransferase family protein [Acidimicrobiales bacterium]MCB1259260.1 acyltransferase family protein [Acidimicrobiales bacterium]
MTSTTTVRRDDLFVFDEAGDASDAASRGRRLPHFPALDGLRGVAVAAVVLYHGGFTLFGHKVAEGGFLGVDAFFVLSGYLITGLLLAEWREHGRLALGSFWAHRARRLLPALFGCLLLVSVYAVWALPPDALQSLRGEMLASEFYVANWWFIFRDVGYFNQFLVSPVRHLWSLAIEEQFYLIWPLVVLFVLRRWDRARAVMWTALIMALASMAWMTTLYLNGAGLDRVYYGTDTRLQSLGVGALLAAAAREGLVVRGRQSQVLLNVLAVVSSVVLALAWSQTPGTSEWLYTGGFCALAVLVSIVILAVTQDRAAPNPVAAVLSWRPLCWLGLISYGVYLYHWPIMVWLDPARTGLSGNTLLAVQIAVTLVVATASYYLIEMPIRRGTMLASAARLKVIVPAAFVAMALVILLVTKDARNTLAFEAEKSGKDRPTPSVASDTPLTDRPAKVLLLGDSVTYTIGYGFEGNADTADVAVWNQAVLYCELVEGRRRELSGVEEVASETCANWPQDWGDAQEQFGPDVVVLGAGPWEIFDRQVDGTWLTYGTPEYDEVLVAELQQIVDQVTADGTPLVLLTSPWFERAPGGDTTAEWTPAEKDRIAHFNDILRQVAADNADTVTIVDLGRFVCGDDDCTSAHGGEALRSDGVHYDERSARVVATWLAPRLRQAALWGADFAADPAVPDDAGATAAAPDAPEATPPAVTEETTGADSEPDAP